MGDKSPIAASDEQRMALAALAGSRYRGEADRARAVLLTLSGWTSPRVGEAFGVREDTVRLWRSDFGKGGVEALKTSVAPGPPSLKGVAALRNVTPLLEEPVADRPNWTIARSIIAGDNSSSTPARPSAAATSWRIWRRPAGTASPTHLHAADRTYSPKSASQPIPEARPNPLCRRNGDHQRNSPRPILCAGLHDVLPRRFPLTE